VTAAERRTFAAVVDAVCAPEPPLPPVADTDAVAAFEHWMSTAPAPNRVAVRAALLGLTACRFRDRPRLRRTRWVSGALAEPLRAAAAISYYGDREVSRVVGYAP
jgi:hypothetical protein